MFNLVLQAHHSTETVLIKIINDIRLNYDSGKISVLVLLDLSAAFDTVNHNILILYRLLKTADLTVVQKTIIDTLHKEGKPTNIHCQRSRLFTECCIQAC